MAEVGSTGGNGIAVIDAPSDLGLRRTGVDGLPDALRAAGLLHGLGAVSYAGCLPVPPFVPRLQGTAEPANEAAVGAFAGRLADRVGAVLDRGQFPLVLGGDCSILLGSALALRRRGRYGLFFLDGHADFYSAETEVNGEVASMELGLVLGHGGALAELDGLRPLVRENDAVVFGVRDLALAAAEGSPDVRQTGAQVVELADVRRLGAAGAAGRALDAMDRDIDGVWVHLDADVLNDAVMPAVDYRMPDGLWPEELTDALGVVLAAPGVVGLEITIYNPTFDDAARSAARTLVNCVRDGFAAARAGAAAGQT